MQKKRTNFLITFIVLTSLSMTHCKKDTSNTNSLYVPGTSDVTANATLQELQDGRTLYINNCGSCHSLYSPDDYSTVQWTDILPGMISRTYLSTSQADLVSKYLKRGR